MLHEKFNDAGTCGIVTHTVEGTNSLAERYVSITSLYSSGQFRVRFDRILASA
jgi:hypothetical protein